MRRLLLIFVVIGLLVCAPYRVARAVAPPSSNTSSTEDGSTKKIVEAPIPQDAAQLAQEVQYAREQVDRYRELIRRKDEEDSYGFDIDTRIANAKQEEAENIEKKAKVENLIKAVESASCEAKESDPKKAKPGALDDITSLHDELSFYGGASFRLMGSWTSILAKLQPIKAENCEALRTTIKLEKSNILRQFDRQKDQLAVETSRWTAQKKRHHENEISLETWRARLGKLLAEEVKLAAEQAKANSLPGIIGSLLPWLIVILGVFSLAIMVMVRRFPSDIQRQWVESGQVIQFMTITVIIIAVLSLGLAEKLSKENLGTLLGTIGGYVLAQGIGRGALKKTPDGDTVPGKPAVDGSRSGGG